MTQSVIQICRYPIKVLRGEDRESVRFEAGQSMPIDRRLALVAMEIDPKTKTVIDENRVLRVRAPELMPWLMSLSTHFDDDLGRLCVRTANGQSVWGAIGPIVPNHQFNRFFNGCSPLSPDSIFVLRVLALKGLPKTVSIVNMATIRDLGARMAGAELDPRRFRGNVCIDGVAPWEELTWDEFMLGNAKFKVIEPILRCDVTSYNVDSGARDMNILKTLTQSYGHPNLGVYAEVVESGTVAVGDPVRVLSKQASAA